MPLCQCLIIVAMIHRDEYWPQAQEAAGYLAGQAMCPADVVLQCGSGLSTLPDILAPEGKRISMDEMPHFPVATVTGHGKEAVYANIGGLRLLILNGRSHLYEGHDALRAGFPAALAKAVEAKLFIATNSAGALNQHFSTGSAMVHSDFINHQGDNALLHMQVDDPSERFLDPKPAYALEASSAMLDHLGEAGLDVHSGTYVAVRGPIFETTAELYMLRGFGADAIGMSTVPELTVCHFFKLPAIGVSVIANECFDPAPVSHEQVLKICRSQAPKLAAGIKMFLEDKTWREALIGAAEATS